MKLLNTYKLYFLTLCVFSPLAISSSLKADSSNPIFAALRQSFSIAPVNPANESLLGPWHCKTIAPNGVIRVITDKVETSIVGRRVMIAGGNFGLFHGINSSQGLRELMKRGNGIWMSDLRVDTRTGNLIVEYNVDEQASGDGLNRPESIAEPGLFTWGYAQCLKVAN